MARDLFFETPELRRKDKNLVRYANWLIHEAAKTEVSPYDDCFENSETLSEWWGHFLTTPHRMILLNGRPLREHELCEFHIAVLLKAEWKPTKGSDVRKIIEYPKDGPTIATFEVRHCGPYTGGVRGRWSAQVTDSNGGFRADFVAVVMLSEDLNPCFGQLFCFPKCYLMEKASSGIIRINQKAINSRTRALNAHWEYYISDYRALEDIVQNHCNYKKPTWTGGGYIPDTSPAEARQLILL